MDKLENLNHSKWECKYFDRASAQVAIPPKCDTRNPYLLRRRIFQPRQHARVAAHKLADNAGIQQIAHANGSATGGRNSPR